LPPFADIVPHPRLRVELIQRVLIHLSEDRRVGESVVLSPTSDLLVGIDSRSFLLDFCLDFLLDFVQNFILDFFLDFHLDFGLESTTLWRLVLGQTCYDFDLISIESGAIEVSAVS
jgi:hypothetical protein